MNILGNKLCYPPLQKHGRLPPRCYAYWFLYCKYKESPIMDTGVQRDSSYGHQVGFGYTSVVMPYPRMTHQVSWYRSGLQASSFGCGTTLRAMSALENPISASMDTAGVSVLSTLELRSVGRLNITFRMPSHCTQRPPFCRDWTILMTEAETLTIKRQQCSQSHCFREGVERAVPLHLIPSGSQ